MTGAVHATAIVVGTTGLLLVGPSGSGKSRLALALISDARAHGQFSALVADDRVFLARHGDVVVARRPASIAGLIEIRGSGIGKVQSIDKAVMHWAILPVRVEEAERLPPEDEIYEFGSDFGLPAIRLQHDLHAPFSVFQALLAARSAIAR
ncbi:hypothetical protein [Rhizobium sp. RU36D]|uniref:HPr kinase/phosphorylase n=1 Tax=Rhizobium sp. RU36D TaxID=1907415 RepID=UPI0009D901A1|nr:hypothetical protein [Rhizobium sp. RU36D]SMC89551.1 Hpr(Ser) kinase/phosphatase [Rhizobium sp. RU36D]